MSDLLPPNASQLERDASEAMARIHDVPIPLRELWNPATCPAVALPYLAWAFSVDRWDSTWTEEAKRAVVADAFFVHSRKGTIAAVRRVVEPLGYVLRVEEWWQQDPLGTPGTFSLDIGVRDIGITDSMREEMERLIADAKPLTRHMTGLALVLESRGTINLAANSVTGDDLTVLPHEPGPIEVGGDLHTGAGEHTIDTVSVTHG